MEPVRDALKRTDDEKDERSKRYLMPPDGADNSRCPGDGSRATLAFQGDVYVVAHNGNSALLQLTSGSRSVKHQSRQVSEDGESTAMLDADLSRLLDLYVSGRRVTARRSPSLRATTGLKCVSSASARKDQKSVAAKILLPPGYHLEDRNQAPRPAVLFIHGSGHATSVMKQWGSYQELRYVFNCYLANKGYVVLDLDYRGSSGYGREWRTDVYMHMGGRTSMMCLAASTICARWAISTCAVSASLLSAMAAS